MTVFFLVTPHNYKISDIREPNNTFREYMGYEEPVVEMYIYAGIKKDCDTVPEVKSPTKLHRLISGDWRF